MANQDDSMSTRQAGEKGGKRTSETHGKKFYQEIGHMGGEAGGKKGGQRVKDLVDKGKQAEGQQ